MNVLHKRHPAGVKTHPFLYNCRVQGVSISVKLNFNHWISQQDLRNPADCTTADKLDIWKLCYMIDLARDIKF